MIQVLKYNLISLLMGFVLDCIFGDPEWAPHMIRWMGSTITALSERIRRSLPATDKGELAGGKQLVDIMLFIFGGGTTIVLFVAYKIHPYLYTGISTVICYQMLAMKDLKKESMGVYHALTDCTINNQTERLQNARKAVARIVGRDTAVLDETGVMKATVETIAENTSDGVIAPLCYMALFGAIGGVLYKTINTLDSMVGYRNEKFLYFGKAAAKLDDFVNYIPARIAAIYMILASGVSGYSMRNALHIYQRDRYCHASPNSAQTEAVMAGALEIRLAGNAYYFGTLYEKPYIGDNKREIEQNDIKRANTLMYLTTFLLLITIVIAYITGFIVLS